MAEVTVTIQLKHNMTWEELLHEINGAGIPSHAKISTYHYDAGNDPREVSYTNLIFRWNGSVSFPER